MCVRVCAWMEKLLIAVHAYVALEQRTSCEEVNLEIFCGNIYCTILRQFCKHEKLHNIAGMLYEYACYSYVSRSTNARPFS